MNQIVLIALRRPYTFVVLAILIVLFGAKSVLQTPTDVFPNIKIPVISVVWSYAGLLPNDVSGRITFFFERALTATVEGIKHIQSHSYYGFSITNIFLQDGIDVASAEAEVAAISQTVVKQLPPDISPPMIMRLEASSVPVAMLRVTSDTLTLADLYNLSITQIRPLLVEIPGAILPHPYGGQPMQLLVSLDQQKLLARHLTASDIHKPFGIRASCCRRAIRRSKRRTGWSRRTLRRCRSRISTIPRSREREIPSEQHQEMYRFIRGLIAFHPAHPILSQERFYTNAEVQWFGPHGDLPHWADSNAKQLASLIHEDEQRALWLMFNVGAELVDFG